MIIYPTVTPIAGREFLDNRRQSTQTNTLLNPTVETKKFEHGDEELDVETFIQPTMSYINEQFEAQRNDFNQNTRDGLEGLLVEPLHKCLSQLPAGVLTDRDFWRYLCLVPLFEFATWRDQSKSNVLPGNGTYGCDGASLHADTISARMFARGEISVKAAGEGSSGPYELAREQGSDIWKSHIMRTLNWQSPQLVWAIFHEEWSKSTPIRQVIKVVKRVRANVLTELLDAEDARNLLEHSRKITESSLEASE